MKAIKTKIVKKTRNISEGNTPDSSVPAFDQMYCTFEIGDNKFIDILCVTDHIHTVQLAEVVKSYIVMLYEQIMKRGKSHEERQIKFVTIH